MPVITNFPQLLQKCKTIQSHRTLILTDETRSVSVYANFDHPYDVDACPTTLSALFEDSFIALSDKGKLLYSVQDLPILYHIGRFLVTIVTKTKDNGITIADGTQQDVSNYIGVGG